ncbi:autotransporter outer membrane beta-barrel domain-containing protein [Pseudomonas knackmussii]|uniref:autotransporter outer membrane beta-barrel domain-containing protein n=1 Tax=Pseudomonas knackmussii TaxID=65741 RepID=UPI0013641E03|nr:autotransporter outer membrane beta-barrel domain-containing protein [Pseudomonas knackmussii]
MPFRRSILVGLILAAAGYAQGGTLNGSSQTVGPDDPKDSWYLSNGATLEVIEGGTTKLINATDSTVLLTGANVSATGALASLDLRRSNATITGSTVDSLNATAVSVNNAGCSGGDCGVTTITDSTLTGNIGLEAWAGADVTLSNTQVEARSAGGSETFSGIALVVTGGTVRVTDGTTLLGERYGVRLVYDDATKAANNVLLDASHIESTTESAIVVGISGTSGPDPESESTVQVTNGSTISAGNGLLLDVRNASTVHFIVDDSQLTGDMLAVEDGSIDVVLQNAASLTGQLNGVDALSLFASQFTGSMHVTQGEAMLAILDGSTATAENGPLLDVQGGSAQMLVDASTAITDVQVIDGTRIDVQLQNGGQLDGQMTVSGGEASLSIVDGGSVNNASGTLVDVQGGSARVAIDNSTVTGSVHVTGGEASLVITDGSTVTAENGQLLDVQGGTATMLVDASTANSDLQVIDGTRVDVQLQNGGQLNGEMTVTGGEASLKIVNGGSVNNASGTLIDVQGGSAQVVIDSSGVNGNILAGGESTDVYVQNDSQLNGQMTVSGGDASLMVVGGSSLTSDTGTLLEVQDGTAQMVVDSATASGDIRVDGGSTDVFVQNGSQFDGHMVVTDGDASLIVSNGANANAGSPLLDVQGGSGELVVSNATVTGDVIASGDGTASVTLQNFGVFTGQMDNVSQLDVNSGGTWNMVDNSRVENVEMQGGTISLGDGSTYHTLTLGSLSGNGSFAMNTDIAASVASGQTQGDFLNVEGQATGDYELRFKNTGAEVQDGSLQVVHTGGGDANFSVLGGGVDVGTYQFQLAQHGDDWFLEATREITPSTASVLGLFSAAPSVWYGELSSLRSRMGEVRNGQGSGVWARTYANRYKLSADADLTYAQNQHGLSLGADGQLPTSDGQWLLGVLAGTSKSDLDLKRGTSGEVDSYYVGLYSTWLAESGFYVDAVLKLNRFDNSSDVRMSDGTKAKGDYNNTGLGLSVEAGKHIKLPDGWFVEPYAQFAALRVNGDDYELDNGMQASSNHANSLLGKLGSSFGKRIPLASGGFAEPYLKLAVAHEFADNNLVRVNGDRFNNDLSGTRGEIGGGVAAQVSEKLQLHLDLDYSKGRNVEQPYGVNLGLRYNF